MTNNKVLMGKRRELIIFTGSGDEAGDGVIGEGGGGGGGVELETRKGRLGAMGVELVGGGT